MAIILKTCFHDPPIGKYEKTKGRNDTGICPFKRSSPFPPPFPLVNHRDVSIARSRRKGGRRGGGRPISSEEDSIAFAFPCPCSIRPEPASFFVSFLSFFLFLFPPFFFSFSFQARWLDPVERRLFFRVPCNRGEIEFVKPWQYGLFSLLLADGRFAFTFVTRAIEEISAVSISLSLRLPPFLCPRLEMTWIINEGDEYSKRRLGARLRLTCPRN